MAIAGRVVWVLHLARGSCDSKSRCPDASLVGIAVTWLGGFYATINPLLIQLANLQCLWETEPNIPSHSLSLHAMEISAWMGHLARAQT